MYFLHWLFLHATTLPPPDHIVWNFRKGAITFGKPNASDFWFSGHVANASVIALATRESFLVLRVLAWGLFVFEVLLVCLRGRTTRSTYWAAYSSRIQFTESRSI